MIACHQIWLAAKTPIKMDVVAGKIINGGFSIAMFEYWRGHIHIHVELHDLGLSHYVPFKLAYTNAYQPHTETSAF
jgi:hypothetical protein